jgi:hypothetical protein
MNKKMIKKYVVEYTNKQKREYFMVQKVKDTDT